MSTEIKVIFKPCPWCKKSPGLYMPTCDIENTDATWLWRVRCENGDCAINPKSPHVSIRKRCKGSIDRLAYKLSELADKWNIGNDYQAYEMKVVDVGPLVEKYSGETNG